MPPPQANYDPPYRRFYKKLAKTFTARAGSRTKLYEQLTVTDYIHLVGAKPIDTSSKFTDRVRSVHITPIALDMILRNIVTSSTKIQDLIDQNVVSL